MIICRNPKLPHFPGKKLRHDGEVSSDPDIIHLKSVTSLPPASHDFPTLVFFDQILGVLRRLRHVRRSTCNSIFSLSIVREPDQSPRPLEWIRPSEPSWGNMQHVINASLPPWRKFSGNQQKLSAGSPLISEQLRPRHTSRHRCDGGGLNTSWKISFILHAHQLKVSR
jgi:hypothetical protein